MSKFYCPFCSSRYQLHKTRHDGVLICGHCGDPLIKKTFINSRQLFGLLAAAAFLAPLLLMIFFVIKDFTNDKFQRNSETLVFLSLSK